MAGRDLGRDIAAALYLDLPYILDSIWRRADYHLNRWLRFSIAADDGDAVEVRATTRPYFHTLPFWLFLLVLLFSAYGPTLDAWCSILGGAGMARARRLSAALLIGIALLLLVWLSRYGDGRASKRFLKANIPREAALRRVIVRALVQAGMGCAVAPIASVGLYLWRHADLALCHDLRDATPALRQLFLALAAIIIAAWCARRNFSTRARIRLEALQLAILIALLWGWAAGVMPTEANQTPYPHVYGVLALWLAAVAVFAQWWARALTASLIASDRTFYQDALRHTELFPGTRRDPMLSVERIIAASAAGMSYHLLHLLLLPSLFVLFAASRWLPETAAAGFAASVGLLTIGNLAIRWRQMVRYITRWFLTGTPLVVSVGVIVLALCRLGRLQYVTTVLDAAPFGVIFAWIVMTYVLFWWFEYAINGALGVQLLRLLGSDHDAAAGRVPYLLDARTALNMPGTGRSIAVQGLGRFMAMGWYRDRNSHRADTAFEGFGFMQLFTSLTPVPQIERRNDLNRRVQLYYLMLNALLAGAAAVFALFYWGHGDRTNTVEPVVAANSAPNRAAQGAAAPAGTAHSVAAPGANLADLLREQARHHRPALIVAASGGGTRAALYTATALEGLAKLHAAQDIVLLSGVSGGGVAAAYFYAHQRDLLPSVGQSPQAWQEFKNRMMDPFIGDVLEGAMEWRVVSRAPLGILLKESFDRQLFGKTGLQHLGDATRPALILNTTIAGHPQEDSQLLRGAFFAPDPQLSCDALHAPYANMSGGRLVFTNLSDASGFPQDQGYDPRIRQIPDVRLPYVIVQDGAVELSAAAALNANFPPVFTNARVTVPAAMPDPRCPRRTYTVTDGGATENLGLLSALYALKQAIADVKATAAPALPQIHLIVLEASAVTYDYTADRGIDAADEAKERLAGGLAVELLQDIGVLLGDEHLNVHDLAMPLAFRSRGGFGTHWMFPDRVEIADPRSSRPAPWYAGWLPWHARTAGATAALDRGQVLALWSALHDPDVAFCGTGPDAAQRDAVQGEGGAQRDDAERAVAGWICGGGPKALPPDLHIAQWRDLVATAHREWR